MMRWTHYALLAVAFGLTSLPNLGVPSLWDMDEGVNAECTREMMETGTWIVPTYNGELRTAKPVMLYWLQRASYNAFGISEWSARLPSVIMSFITILIVYELGRRVYSPGVGLLGGIVLGSCFEFVKLSHAATPDATFICFNTLTVALFHLGQREGRRWWFVPCGAAAGLAVLTKGPAGAALPGLVILLTLAWNRELRSLWDRRLLWAILAFILVAAPWYGFVAAETRGAYIKAFFGNENVNRFLSPMENHRGPFYYYLIAVLLFFTPWSVVLGPTVWNAVVLARRTSADGSSNTTRFLLVWVMTYLVFFSFAATKLPNYIAPLYPALALLTANALIAWVHSTATVPRWMLTGVLVSLVLTGVVVGAALLLLGGSTPVEIKGLRKFPGLATWSVLGLVPIAGAIAIIAFLRRQQPTYAVNTLAVTSVVFMAIMAAFPLVIIDRAKAAKSLVEESGAHQADRDIRLASLEYTQESMTFYAERRVERLQSIDAACDFLASPRPGYLFVPAKVWEERIAPSVGPHRIAARRFDTFRNAEILAVTNDGVNP